MPPTTEGHPGRESASRSSSIPSCKKQYGDVSDVRGEPKAHIRTEFGFDMVQVAQERYTSDAYHDFIGFEVAKPLLERAFRETYGLQLSNVLGDEDLAIGSFRRAVSKVIPAYDAGRAAESPCRSGRRDA